MNVRALESRSGANSDRKIAQPRPSGPAMTSATTEVTTVPYTNGRAPNWPVTGFQVCVNANDQPNLARESSDADTSLYRTSTVRMMMDTANSSVTKWAILSPESELRTLASGRAALVPANLPQSAINEFPKSGRVPWIELEAAAAHSRAIPPWFVRRLASNGGSLQWRPSWRRPVGGPVSAS